jgi:hypothetical protein
MNQKAFAKTIVARQKVQPFAEVQLHFRCRADIGYFQLVNHNEDSFTFCTPRLSAKIRCGLAWYIL